MPDLIGTTLGRYRITAKIGEGGMGEVYRAHDERLDRDVAIKVLPGEVAQDPERLARFEREAKLLAALNHQNIATIFGLETAVILSERESEGLEGVEGSPEGGSDADLEGILRLRDPAGRSAQNDWEPRMNSRSKPQAPSLKPQAPSPHVTFLVMELVEGEDLAARIQQGAIPVGDSLPIALQIAEGLEAAHHQGIIHRDLKPANVMQSPEGTVKLLDFGLAKAWQPEESNADMTASPTLTAQMTAAGVLLGTAAYMSPEQARGKVVDKRTDVWAFGCVLYEMLTGGRAFGGETVTDTLAAVVTREPDWQRMPSAAPRASRRLLRRCLRKEARDRLRDMGDARIEILEAMAGEVEGSAEARPLAQGGRWSRLVPWVVATLAVLASVLVLWTAATGSSPRSAEVARLTIPLPDDAPFHASERSSLALSGDGTRVVYVTGRTGETHLMMRSLNDLTATEVPETGGAVAPFFSPDGSWIGYFTRSSVGKVAVAGGTPQRVGDSPPVSRGAYWNTEASIIFNPNKTAGLAMVSDTGGRYELVTEPDVENHVGGHCWPGALPGTRAVLATILPPGATSYDEAQVVAIDLDSGQEKVLIDGGTYARYTDSGHLVFARRGSLLAAAFDVDRLEVKGSPIPVIDGVLSDPASGVAHFAVSDNGTLVYASGGQRASSPRSLAWVDRDGNTELVTPKLANYAWPRLSPDGRQLATVIEGATDDLWVLDLGRGAMRRLTFEGRSVNPIWTPDGLSVTYSKVRADLPELYSVAVDGSGDPQPLAGGNPPTFACSWSPDGENLAHTARGSNSTTDLYLSSRDGSSRPFLATRFNEAGAQFSPDGRWIAYISDESGRFEIYLRRFPDTGAKWQVSTNGGRRPLWSPDGREITFLAGDALFSVTIATDPELRIGTPEVIVEERIAAALPDFANFDISRDGRRFVIVRDVEPEAPVTELIVVLNWFDELERLMPKE